MSARDAQAGAVPLPEADDRGLASTWPGLLTVMFLGVTAGVQMSDRGLQAILSPAIRATFQVGDAALGALHGVAGILIASAVAVPLARLADAYSRKRILLALIGTWTALTALGALAPTFPLFFLGRAATGITEFAMIPVVYSLIPDLVSERFRVGANLMFAALMAIGASAGFYFGGTLLEFVQRLNDIAWFAAHDPWRRAMLLLATAGIPLLLLGALIRNPPRRVSADVDASGSLTAFVARHRREILLFVCAAGTLAVAVQAVIPMLAMALDRRFPGDLRDVGHMLGMLILIGNLVSFPIAWGLDRRLRGRLGTRARPAVMAGAALLSVPVAVALGLVTTLSGAWVAVGVFLLTTCIANALIPTMLQDLFPATLRARAFAIYSFLIAAFCALGPVLSGALSQYLLDDRLLVAIALAAAPMLLVATACAARWAWPAR
ncbi:MFS transporter [Luteimonas abyssi]|uniref:MFS transporter n=1 Tax=Luteimonas abyssi TaxID=1247514 RepID=UPI000737D6CE|nr:MFS transporter [Luteimonas abyssi]